MKILILGGFLGAGKTSLLVGAGRYLVEHSESGGAARVAVIENEIGNAGVDDKLTGNAGFETTKLFSGCVCCTLGAEIIATIRNIRAQLDPEYLVIESSGVGIPFKIQDTIRDRLGLQSAIVVLADCQRWQRLTRAAGTFIQDQLVNADLVLANKTDLVQEEERDAVVADLRARCPEAEVMPCCLSGGENETVFARIRALLEE